MKFTLDFQSDNYGKKTIDQPFGTSDINFSLKQKENGMGRDVSFSGNEIQFEFTHLRNHELKQLLYYRKKFGFEAIVVLTIEIDPLNKYNCDLDFATAETDGLEYFRCKGIEDGKLQIVKARKSVKVDLLSDVDVDGNYIGGLVPENILLLAKPVIQSSRWEQTEDFDDNLFSYDTRYYWVNPCSNLTKSDILDSFTFFEPKTFNGQDFLLITAATRLKKISISLKNVDINLSTDVDEGGNGYVDYSLEIHYGTTFDTSKKAVLFSKTLDENQSFELVDDYFYTIDSLERGDSVWVFMAFKVRQSASGGVPFQEPKFECFTKIKGVKTEISAESTDYNSTSKSLRLVDVMRQVVKSISGLQINAPRFEAFGEFYDNRLFNGNFLRGVTTKPFYVSLEDIEKSITEMRGDWEIGSDGKVFFGIESDFYTDNEIAFFDNTQFSEMKETFNPKYKINEFWFKYQNYQSLKENEEPNSADTIHGESRLVLFNKQVENKKEVEVDWTRDAFLIESTRRKSLIITEETASQDDDTIFCIDSINTTFDNEFTEVTNLQHTYNDSTFLLSLKNDGTINFVSLGITVNSYFRIATGDINSGTYQVVSVNPTTLELSRVLNTMSGAGNGNRLTKYTYILPVSVVPFTNYTNQGFTETSGLGSADSYSNRRYSIKRNIYNYWKSYLATANLYWKNSPLKNTWYKNNGDYTAKYDGVKLTEKDVFLPDNPILSPVLYNDVVFANVHFKNFIILQNAIRSQRGFVRSIDNNSRVIRIYPTSLEYSILEKKLSIKGEEKYEPVSMTIETKIGFYLINSQTRVGSVVSEIKNEMVYIYDTNRFRLYNPVYWMEVSINGATAPSKEILEGWLKLLV